MKISGYDTNDVVLKELGKRIQDRRIDLNMTQSEVSKEASISMGTLSKLENGDNATLSSLISVLRVLRILDNINSLVAERKTNPLDTLALGHNRKRVRKSSTVNETPWVWGDEKWS